MQWQEPGPTTEPKRRAFQSKTPCKDGRTQHRYDPITQVCIHCGHKRPYDINAIKSGQKTERAPRRVPAAQKITKLQLYKSAYGLIQGAQTIAVSLNPSLQPDALSTEEITLLADALADEADGSERFKRLLIQLQQRSRHAKLILVLIVIGVPRLVRHDLLPAGFDNLTGAAVALAAGGTPDGDRGDEQREVDLGGGGAFTPEAVPDRDSHENGPQPSVSEVPRGNGYEDTPVFGEPPLRAAGAKAKVRGAGA